MKATELIAELQAAVRKHGDLDVLIRDCSDGFDWSHCSVCPDPASEWEDVAGTIDINVWN